MTPGTKPIVVKIPEHLRGYLRELVEIGLWGTTMEAAALELMLESLRRHVAGNVFHFSYRRTKNGT